MKLYAITNEISGKTYFGTTTRPKDRFHQHAHLLRKGKHYNKALQEDWNLYGEENFIYLPFLDIPAAERMFFEKWAICCEALNEVYNVHNSKCFN